MIQPHVTQQGLQKDHKKCESGWIQTTTNEGAYWERRHHKADNFGVQLDFASPWRPDLDVLSCSLVVKRVCARNATNSTCQIQCYIGGHNDGVKTDSFHFQIAALVGGRGEHNIAADAFFEAVEM